MVEEVAEVEPVLRHGRRPTWHVTRGNRDLSGVPCPPHLTHKIRTVREVRVQRQDVLPTRRSHPVDKGLPVPFGNLEQDSRPGSHSGFHGPVIALVGDDNHLVREVKFLENSPQPRQEYGEVRALVQCRDEHRHIGLGAH